MQLLFIGNFSDKQNKNFKQSSFWQMPIPFGGNVEFYKVGNIFKQIIDFVTF